MAFRVSPFVCRVVFPVLLAVPAMSSAFASDPFTKPSKEELSMTSMPGYPGVAAVVLFKEEIDRDDLQVKQHYMRIKILTEKGKDLANVELPFVSVGGNWDYNGDNKDLTDIMGRTIHPDGTVIPFTGKPYLKTIEKSGTVKFQKRVFTLPDVEVGSIIEYRYSERIDGVYESPDWYIQGPLYVKAAHYAWYPTTRSLVSSRTGAPITAISWFPVLPAGAKVEHKELPAAGTADNPPTLYEVSVKDVPPVVDEEFAPPTKSFTYRVLFNFSEYRSAADYWKGEGKELFKRVDSFANVDDRVRQETQTAIGSATTSDEKLKKIYAAVEALENTSYTRSHKKEEDKAEGGKVSNAGDVLTHKRGSSWQITSTFLAMTRAAGFKSYGMYVPDRTSHLFTAQWLSTGQLDDLIAVVNVDGKEVFFDPGERYCDYGHLTWQHGTVTGLRESPEGIKLDNTPADIYTSNRTARVANLTMDDKGVVSGKVSLTYYGAPALSWRHRALAGDEQSIKRTLRTSLERMVPRSLEVKVDSVEGLDSYEKPLVVNYMVKGVIASATGKRLVVAPDLFTMNDVALFPHDKRDVAVYFHYPQIVQDAERVNLPASMKIEAIPDSVDAMFQKRAQYKMKLEQGPNFVVARRTFVFGDVLVLPSEYPELKKFYATMQSKDKEPAVITSAEVLDLPKAIGAPAHASPDADDDDDDDNGDNSGAN